MAKKEPSLAWMIAKPFIGVCIPLLISVGVMYNMSGGSFSLSSLMPDFAAPFFNKMSSAVEGSLSTSSSQNVFKWKDKDGVWHFSETAPKDIHTDKVESFTVSSNITVIQMPQPKPEPEKAKSGRQGFVVRDGKSKKKEPGELASDPMELIEQAKLISEQMEQRNNTLKGI